MIEFAVLAMPFALLVFAILESCISFAAEQLLTNTTDEIARQVRTGQLKATDLDETTLRNLICGKLSIMVGNNCQSADYLAFDLESYDTFAEAAQVRTNKTAGGDLDTTGFGVHPGGPLTKNMLRVYYKWPVILNFGGLSLATSPDGTHLMGAVRVFKNEPFTS